MSHSIDASIGVGSGIVSVFSVLSSIWGEDIIDISTLVEKWGALGFVVFVMWLLLFRSEKRQDMKDAKDVERHSALVKAVDAFDASVREMRRVADRQDEIAQQQTVVSNHMASIKCRAQI